MFKRFFRRKTQSQQAVASATLTAGGLACVVLKRQEDNQWALQQRLWQAEVAPEAIGECLSAWVKEHNLNGLPFVWLLSPNDYKLLQVEHLNVPEEELIEATRWRVKDLLKFPAEEAIINVCPIPPHGAGQRRKLMYVVATEKTFLLGLKSTLESTGFKLEAVDIAEMGLRNINDWLSPPAQPTILLHVQKDSADVVITRDQHLFFTRRMQQDFAPLFNTEKAESGEGGALQLADGNAPEQQLIEKLALEVQRSLDYFTSQMAQPMPQQLWISGLSPQDSEKLGALLPQSNLLKTLLLTEHFADLDAISAEEQSCCLTALGGAFRWEEHSETAD